uniref:Uncharacterized protein n=1 Tax=Meloidogyne javanica TaxID=6303 RepID=A0A915N647_MELJA
MLIKRGILQPKLVDSFFKFGLKCNDIGSSINNTGDGSQPSNSLDDVQNTFLESQAESLVRLFFFGGSPESISRIPKEDFEHCSLELDFVKIHKDYLDYSTSNYCYNMYTTYGYGTYDYGEDYSVGAYNPRYHYAAVQSAGFDLRTDDGLPKTMFVH